MGPCVTPNGAPSLIRAWIPDARRRLQGAPDPRSFEIAIARVVQIGAYARRFGSGDDAVALMREIIATHGRFPLIQDNAAAAHDLEVAALGSLYDLQSLKERMGSNWEPAPTRERFDPIEELLREPAAGRVGARETAARVAELEQELGQLAFNASRCHVLAELRTWLGPVEAEQRFASQIAPIFDEAGRVRLSAESLCRIAVALQLAQVSPEQRIALLLRLLEASPDRVTEYDGTADDHHPFLVYITGKPQVRAVVAHVLAGHLDWIDRDPALRTWLQQQGLQPSPARNDLVEESAWSALQPALRAVLERADGETAQAIVRAWIEDVRTTLLRTDITTMYPGEVARARMMAIGTHARRHGLEAEARMLFDQILNEAPGSPFRSRYTETHNAIARTAVIARALLAGGAGEPRLEK